MKQFVKALNKDGDCFKYICRQFPGLSIEKTKGGIFDGPQIRTLMRDSDFTNHMNTVELNAWVSFTDVVTNLLGNHKADNYKQLVRNMLTAYEKLGANMSIKVHFLFSHLDRFPGNLICILLYLWLFKLNLYKIPSSVMQTRKIFFGK